MLIETPMAQNLSAASDLVKAAQEKKLLLVEAIWLSYGQAHDESANMTANVSTGKETA